MGGAGNRINQSFDFVDAPNGDYHLGDGDTAARDAGTDLSADAAYPFDTDIDGDARTGTWDIGADEAGASIPTAPQITSPLAASGTVGQAFSYTIIASGTRPITFDVHCVVVSFGKPLTASTLPVESLGKTSSRM